MVYASQTTVPTHLPVNPAERPRYSSEQLIKYFKRIELPERYATSPILDDAALATTKEHGLPLLKALHRHHLASIRFENLELHYSAHKKISLRMDDLFTKFVERGSEYGRGGRCMENNGFFGTALRSLGYDVRNCAGRVSRSQDSDPDIREKYGHTYLPWNHMVNLVRLDNVWYVVDVGMGATGPQIVYPLEDGFEAVAMSPRLLRLQKRCISEHAARTDAEAQMLWCFDVCRQPDVPRSKRIWIPVYCFTETEFLPQDYEMMSWFTSTSPSSIFTQNVLCTKLLLDEQRENVIGDITLFNDQVRKTIHGKREEAQMLRTEEERIRALKESLDVTLTREEMDGIPPARKLG